MIVAVCQFGIFEISNWWMVSTKERPVLCYHVEFCTYRLVKPLKYTDLYYDVATVVIFIT